jgi:hypothetical protein
MDTEVSDFRVSVLDILEPTSKTVDALMRLQLPSGVDIEIKLWALTPDASVGTLSYLVRMAIFAGVRAAQVIAHGEAKARFPKEPGGSLVRGMC